MKNPNSPTARASRPAHTYGRRRGGLTGLLSGLLLQLTVSAQNFSIDWFTIAGGGGESTGGAYSLSGTIGQPDAGQTTSAGNFSVTGGFWSLFAIQAIPAPVLTISLAGNNSVKVSWPSASVGFALEQNPDLRTASWSTPMEQVSDDGTNKSILVKLPTGTRFYRLRRG